MRLYVGSLGLEEQRRAGQGNLEGKWDVCLARE